MVLWEAFLRFLDRKVTDYGAQYKTYAIFGLYNFPVSYFTLLYVGTHENAYMRGIATVLCLPLLFTKYWPVKAKKYLNLYWFSSLLFGFPIFGIYMLLENHLSAAWLINIPTGLFILILLTDWVMFIALLALGIPIGWLLFLATGQPLIIEQNISEISLLSFLHTYFYSIVVGIIFARGNERKHQERIQTMKMLAGSIAHELRTPLSAMIMNARALSKFIPYYQDAYTKAKNAELTIHEITSSEEKYLNEIPQEMQIISQNAHTMITMLLANLSESASDKKVELCSLKHCVEEALNTYPFSTSEKNLVHWESANMNEDITFLGHKELTKHVLFNLIKNALYAISSAGKGEIFITLEPDFTTKSKCQLVFRDTGLGISPNNLRHIFDRFYTKTLHGTGIGLAFCKATIEGFGGNITCTSQEGEHTTFTITLPKVVDNILQAA